MQHELGLGRGPGGEIEQHGIAGRGRRVRREALRFGIGFLVVMPTRNRRTDRDAPEPRGELIELTGLAGGGDHRTDPAARDAVGQILQVFPVT